MTAPMLYLLLLQQYKERLESQSNAERDRASAGIPPALAILLACR